MLHKTLPKQPTNTPHFHLNDFPQISTHINTHHPMPTPNLHLSRNYSPSTNPTTSPSNTSTQLVENQSSIRNESIPTQGRSVTVTSGLSFTSDPQTQMTQQNQNKPRKLSQPLPSTNLIPLHQNTIISLTSTPPPLNPIGTFQTFALLNAQNVSPEILISPSQKPQQQKQKSRWTMKSRETLKQEQSHETLRQEQTVKKWSKGLEKFSVLLGQLNSQSIKKSQDIRLSQNLRSSLNDCVQKRQNFQNLLKPINPVLKSVFKPIEEHLRIPKDNCTRFLKFQIGDLRKTDLKDKYFQIQSTQMEYHIRGDQARNAEYSNSEIEAYIKVSKQLNYISYVNWNIDMLNIENHKTHSRVKKYMEFQTQDRLLMMQKFFVKQIYEEKLFIFIEEAYTKESRAMVRKVVKTTKTKSGHYYYYPEHLDEDCDMHATIILSKYKVRFGRIKFTNKEKTFAEQSFCQFEMFNLNEGRFETHCIVCCHWKSSGGKKNQQLEQNRRLRTYQKDCCDDFLKRRGYHMMSVVGDTNLDKDETLENDEQFADTYDKTLSQYEGTMLLVQKNGRVIEVRPDRILVNRGNQKMVEVVCKIHDLFLTGYEHKKKQEKIILDQDKKFWNHIRPSDHFILDGKMYMLRVDVDNDDDDQ